MPCYPTNNYIQIMCLQGPQILNFHKCWMFIFQDKYSLFFFIQQRELECKNCLISWIVFVGRLLCLLQGYIDNKKCFLNTKLEF